MRTSHVSRRFISRFEPIPVRGTRHAGAWVDERPLPPTSPYLTLANLETHLAKVDRRCRIVWGRSCQALGLTPVVLRTLLQRVEAPIHLHELVDRFGPLAARRS